MIEKMVENSLVDDGQTREKLAQKLQLEKDDRGKYLTSYIEKVAEEKGVSVDEAKIIIRDSNHLMSIMFILA